MASDAYPCPLLRALLIFCFQVLVLSFCLILSPSLYSFGSREPQPELRGECPGAEEWFQVKCCPLGQSTFLRDSLNSGVPPTQQPLVWDDHLVWLCCLAPALDSSSVLLRRPAWGQGPQPRTVPELNISSPSWSTSCACAWWLCSILSPPPREEAALVEQFIPLLWALWWPMLRAGL